MSTKVRAQCEDGFSLIEVLVSMIILAVGFLGLEAVAIGSSRLVQYAEQQSEYATLTSSIMERSQDSIRRNVMPCSTTPVTVGKTQRNDVITRTVTATGTTARNVTITVTPTAGKVRPQAMTLSSVVLVLPAGPCP